MLLATQLAACAGLGLPTQDPAVERSPIGVYDPWEGMNRYLYRFNAEFDRWVFLPVVDAYAWTVPPILRDRVADFFGTIGDLTTFANLVLQAKLPEAGQTALRFAANVGIGMFGFVDVATAMGMPKYSADFGQTLGVWGLTTGPYLMLPVAGPSSLRDTTGTVVDTVAFSLIDPFGLSSLAAEYPAITATDVINRRYLQQFRYYESGSLFEYDLVRFLATKKRELEAGRVEEGGDRGRTAFPAESGDD